MSRTSVCASLSAAALIAAFAGAPAQAQNNGLPSMRKSSMLVMFIAERGEECGLLNAWEAASMDIMARRDRERYDAEERAEVEAEALERAAATACDDEFLNAYIEGSRRGMRGEQFSNFLAIYRGVATMEAPPSVFDAATGRLDYAPAIAAIDAGVAALDAEGLRPEGGGPWDEFMERTGGMAADMADQLGQTDASWDRMTPDEVASYLVDTALVVELWLADQGADE